MDKEWIVKKFDDYGLVLEDKVVLDAAFDCAEAIAQAHEEDKQATIQAHLREVKAYQGTAAQREAQVAVMAEALRRLIAEATNTCVGYVTVHAVEQAQAALQSAPKVLWRGTLQDGMGEMEPDGLEDFYNSIDEKGITAVDVIVLERQPEPEKEE